MRGLVGLLLLCPLRTAPAYASQPCPRIVSLAPYITETLQWLGLGRCIVGVSRYDKLKLPHAGGVLDPDAEALGALKPQLIFAADWVGGRTLSAATPKGARSYRLHGFQSMRQIEDNLREVGVLTGLPGVENRVLEFHVRWMQAARRIDGHGRRALLLSACSGDPYSFGRQTWLSDLFSRAGFVMADERPGIHMLPPGGGEAVRGIVNELHPDVVFLIHPKESRQCRMPPLESSAMIVHLDGENFLDPAPTLLPGLVSLSNRFASF